MENETLFKDDVSGIRHTAASAVEEDEFIVDKILEHRKNKSIPIIKVEKTIS